MRPRDPVEPVVRYETPPGRQGQVHFGTFTLPWGRPHALLVVHEHSRLLWLRYSPTPLLEKEIGLASEMQSTMCPLANGNPYPSISSNLRRPR